MYVTCRRRVHAVSSIGDTRCHPVYEGWKKWTRFHLAGRYWQEDDYPQYRGLVGRLWDKTGSLWKNSRYICQGHGLEEFHREGNGYGHYGTSGNVQSRLCKSVEEKLSYLSNRKGRFPASVVNQPLT